MRIEHRVQPYRHLLPSLETAVFGIDRWLRYHQGVFEFTSNPGCIFRVQHAQAAEHVALSDGTSIGAHSAILDLHLWNEHVPAMPAEGPTVGWGRHLSRAIDRSLRDLAYFLEHHPELDDVVAVRADMCLGTSEKNAMLMRLSGRYGFEGVMGDAAAPGTMPLQLLHRLGENVFMFLLVLAANPAAARAGVLRRSHALAYLSRAALERRYSGAPNHHRF